ncbi:hypothetical protein [Arthrobacter woluwensis]|uniref:hypothetical protein n=1 Tax=Arthrobacter woluwensis TaxID=156980 RepID=UPI00082434EF|nr:hypothetical protein [Arthrobacter woluwensis]
MTNELRNPGSPVRAYLDGVSPILAATRGNSSTARQAAAALGLVDLAGKALLVPAGDAVDKPLSGTAFDIRARIELGGFAPAGSTSAAGIEALSGLAALVDNGEHRARVLSEAFRVGDELLGKPGDASDLTRASILFAYCEQVYRGGPDALSGTLGAACDEAEGGLGLAQAISEAALDDVEALMRASRLQIDAWRERIAAGARFEPNPGFSGAKLLGGADGDWMIGDALIDCKAYGELSVAKLRDFLRQLLGYVMLDLEDALGIREVGVWLPRQQSLKTWTLEQLLGGDPETLLPKLREGFVGATMRNQIAVHVPVSERRKLQLLADNRHTPHSMLMALAQSDDTDLRFRVGRNASAPTDVVRRLADDRYARVREGVAMNTAAPGDVLHRLAEDSSATVRRAAAANRSMGTMPAHQQPELTRHTNDAVLSGHGPDEMVLSGVQPPSELYVRGVEINQDRDPDGTPGVALSSTLWAMLRGDGDQALDSILPESGRVWAWRTGRSLRLPAGASQGLPVEVLVDLMSDQRPAYIRRIAARMRPIAHTAVRRELFADADPGIRWDALERSMTDPDPLLAEEVLAELGGSRTARIKFITDGLEPHERWRTPTESSDRVAQLIARHPATPSEALAGLVAEKSPEVLLALAGNPALGPEPLESLTNKMASTRAEAARVLFAESARTPAAVLEALSTDKRTHLRAAVAGNPSTPQHVLSRLAQDSSTDVRLGVMTNPQSPTELAAPIAEALLATSEDHDLHAVLVDLSGRPELAVPDGLVEDALDRLSKSRVRDPDLRHYVAGHPRTGIGTMERLGKSRDAEVRIAVSENPHIPQSALEGMSRDEDASVRRAVARNDRLSQDLLNALLLDDDLDVRIAAYRTPDAEEDADDEPSLSRDVSIAVRPTVPMTAELQEMAANPRAEVRIRAAYSEHATPDILAFLGGERRSAKVRRAVAAHPNTPPEVLRSLAGQDDADTLLLVAFNQGTTVDLLADLAGRSAELALVVALNPDAPLEILEALSNDSDLLVKFVAEAQQEERRRPLEGKSTTQEPHAE